MGLYSGWSRQKMTLIPTPAPKPAWGGGWLCSQKHYPEFSGRLNLPAVNFKIWWQAGARDFLQI